MRCRVEGYVTATEAARQLGVSLQTVIRRIEAGAIRAERAGQRTWLISTDEVERVRCDGPHDQQTIARGDAGGVPDTNTVAALLEKPRLLTKENLERLLEVSHRLRNVRLPMSSTEMLRQEREERTRELARRHGISVDEPDADSGG